MTIETSFRPLQAAEDHSIRAKPRVDNGKFGVHTLRKDSAEDHTAVSSEQTTSKTLELHAKVSGINEAVQEINRELNFRVDDDSGRLVVKVIDRDSGDTIRQIPTEQVLDLERQLAESNTQGGLIKVVA